MRTRWQVYQGGLALVAILLAVSLEKSAQAGSDHAPPGKYLYSEGWPGPRGDVFDMQTEDKPVCEALTKAINAMRTEKPLLACRVQSIAGTALTEIGWKPVATDDPITLLKKMVIAGEARFGRHPTFSDVWEAEFRQKFASGAARLETATLNGAKQNQKPTILLRLNTEECRAKTDFPYLDIKVADGGNFDDLGTFTGLGPIHSGFEFAGRGYLFGVSDADWEYGKRLTCPPETPPNLG